MSTKQTDRTEDRNELRKRFDSLHKAHLFGDYTKFGDIWVKNGRELVLLRPVGADLYLMADEEGGRHYVNITSDGYVPKATHP